jgi:hypothetical protein
MHLRSWFVGVSRQAAKLRKQRPCGHRWRRGAGPWALPSDHQGEITSSPGRMSPLCSKETIVPPINGRDSLHKTDFSIHYPLLILISEALHLFDAFAALEQQVMTLLITPDHATTSHNQCMASLCLRETGTDSFFDPQQTLEPCTPTIRPQQTSTYQAPEMWQKTFNILLDLDYLILLQRETAS